LGSQTLAQVRDGEGVRNRNQGGGVNLAPADPVLQVVSVDSYSRIVQMRRPDGKTVNVYVGEGIYPLSQLNPATRCRSTSAARWPRESQPAQGREHLAGEVNFGTGQGPAEPDARKGRRRSAILRAFATAPSAVLAVPRPS